VWHTVGTIERPRSAAFAPYLPRLAREWRRDGRDDRARVVDGTLVSVDLSGFTSLSERLAAKGRAGAEELILAISGTFEALIGIATRRGGDVLKFRGDALLLLFDGDGHELRAAHASAEMQWFIEQTGTTMSSVGEVRLRMATGVYSGPVHFFVVGTTHRELVVTGPATTETVRLEDAAEAGEVLVSAATAAALPPDALGGERDGARLLVLDAELQTEARPEPEASESDGDLVGYVPAPLRDHLAVEAEEGEHRQVTAAFVKWAGTDDLLEREGVDAVLAGLDHLGRVVGETAEELGVTWLESDVDVNGGKLYLVAGAPASAGADEERMLRAVRRILDAGGPLPLRAGVNRGPVFAGDIGASSRRTYAVMGDTVNLAARLTARAQTGQILATADVLDRSRTTFETTHQPFLVKGKERPVTAYSVGALVGVRDDERRRDLPLVNRARELEALGAAIEAARRRSTQVVEIVGEPGIGKSRLVEELRGRAVGFQQLVARCEQYETAHAFFAVRSLLRPLVGITPEQTEREAGELLAAWVGAVMPDLAPWLPLLAIPFEAEVPPTPESDTIDPAFRRDRLHAAVDQFLTRVLLMPTLILAEDGHWLDDASRYLLRHLAESATPRPWLVCVTRRPEGEPVLSDPWARLELAPLDGAEAAELALAAAGDVALSQHDLDSLVAHAAGNPLFVGELAAAARAGGSVEELPDSVESLITARIDRLDPGDRLLLRYASVAGPSFDLGLIGEIAADGHTDPGDLEAWRRLGEFLHFETSETLSFRHDLFRAVAYAGLSFRRRREIHARVAEGLERRANGGADELAGLLSLHFLEAQRYEQAWRYAVLAADRARERYANVVAAELYERALAAAAHLPDLPVGELARVAEALGDVSELFGNYEAAAAAYARAEELSSGSATLLLLKQGILRERGGQYDDALGWYRRGLEAAGDVPSAVELELAYAGVLHRQGANAECVEWARRAAEKAEAAGLRTPLAHAYSLIDLASTALGAPDLEARERALPLYEESGDLLGYANALNNRGIDAYYEGDWAQAVELYRRSGEVSRRAGDVVNTARAENNEAEVLSDQGRLAEAERLLDDALRTWRAAGYAIGVALATSNLGRAAARAGRFEEAETRLAEARAGFEEIGAASFALETRGRQAEALVLAGERGRAREAVVGTLADAQEAGAGKVLLAFLHRVAGLAALQSGDKEAAAAELEASRAIADELGASFELALTLEAQSELALRGGSGDAAALAAAARELLDGLGVVSTPRIPLL
jgi:predicted ATPase/class 3 adenylate cyclase